MSTGSNSSVTPTSSPSTAPPLSSPAFPLSSPASSVDSTAYAILYFASSPPDGALAVNDSASSLPLPANHVQHVALAILLSVVIVIVIFGNTLVILAVITTRRLRTVTNCFVMSLAVADWLVGICVMPPAVAYTLMGTWELGWILCDIWVSLDILLCTASILSLCAISIDRYLAVTQPLRYSRNRRSKRLAFGMILVVWVSSMLISCPPIFGWYEPGKHANKTCRYNKNTGYVIYSAMGSFFIPMVVMLYVYIKISCVVAQRHDQLAQSDATHSKKSAKLILNAKEESDVDRSSECEEAHVKCSRYFRQVNACAHSPESNHNEHPKKVPITPSRSIRSNINYTFNHVHEPLTPTRSASLCRSGLPIRSSFKFQFSSRPESLHLDASMLNYEPASRVSSFRRETKTAQTLSIVMGGFIACWLPFFIFYLLTPFITTNETTTLIMSYLTWLGWINSAINPFIYAFYSPDFRIAFWRLTVKHFSNNRRADFASQHK
ncbi:unnamed protein product [Acanthoscelides obtectus]|uniref:G-protein coupled receptors family 1 profile domain-containing protein n=1 Tax=Acanthoscelides obtectus TaxID=200917 RepID=A0A9P0LUU4_ACAOB|nr:unnamed protein product [Acanthoscelides obtectus]CAK1620365.1 hypothetical protein AOBTE_LOCUS339 [Acanthoscelides obtectus]